MVAPTSISPRVTKLKTYVVLTKDRRLSKDNVHEMTTHDGDFVAYESFAAVLSRYQNDKATPARELRWSDLNRPRFHLARYLNDANKAKASSQKMRKRQLKRSVSSGNATEVHAWALCFEFLDLHDLQVATMVCSEWREIIATSQFLLVGLYCRQWRPTLAIVPSAYMELQYPKLLTLNRNRSAHLTFDLSSRSTFTRQADCTYMVVNNSMLRSFARGAVDSVRGAAPLPILSCAQALDKQISYYEVSMKGCGSMGIVSLSDNDSKTAYGFGSSEHVGWKGISYGYHGNDGDFVYNDGSAPYGGDWKPFGPSWGSVHSQSDAEAATYTVGCGVNLQTHELFFTLNGKLVGIAPVTIPEGDYTLAVSLHAFEDTAVVNLGSVPFRFDIEGFCASP